MSNSTIAYLSVCHRGCLLGVLFGEGAALAFLGRGGLRAEVWKQEISEFGINMHTGMWTRTRPP